MTKRVGFVQTRGIGDIIIALPIADHYIENGWEVFWPIDDAFLEMFKRVKPTINFLSVSRPESLDLNYFLYEPLKLIGESGCEKTVVLYSYLEGVNIPDIRLSASLKFDEYKYAIAGVPFARKWLLKYERDVEREEALFESLTIHSEYVVIHDQGSTMNDPIAIPDNLTQGKRIVRISNLTDSVFDWRLTLERAAGLVMVNSCFANFVEQLNLENEKAIFLNWPVHFTPVFINNWRFIFPSK